MKTFNKMLSVAETNTLIEKGHVLSVAGEECLLKQLSKGNWVGGTIPYFMSNKGACFSTEKLFVSDFTSITERFTITNYTEEEVNNLGNDHYHKGFSFILLPGFTDILEAYSLMAESNPEVYDIPTLGWVTGVNLEQREGNEPKVFEGDTGEVFGNKMVVLHIELKDKLLPELEILNIFEPDLGTTIQFMEDGFSCTRCLINGKTVNLSDYISDNKIDTRFPIIADYVGAKINCSFESIDEDTKKVNFYAPIRKDKTYYFAKPIDDYVGIFKKHELSSENVVSSCNCILNYVHSELEGEKIADFTGPFTFGEIAYTLLNQTMVYLRIIEE